MSSAIQPLFSLALLLLSLLGEAAEKPAVTLVRGSVVSLIHEALSAAFFH